jgi:hypothetical protein
VKKSSQENGAANNEQLNYFNYFTEVEEEFVRRRGKPLLVSPMDWALIESWKTAGIPLNVVLRAINSAFDAYDARTRKFRKVNSIFYCQQEVESTYAEYQLSQVGAKSNKAQSPAESDQSAKPVKKESVAIFPKDVLLDFFARSTRELEQAASLAASSGKMEVQDVMLRAKTRLAEISAGVEKAAVPDAEAIERDLDGLDRLILSALKQAAGEDGIAAISIEAEKMLDPYRKKMDRGVYEQTRANFIARRLREINEVPRLSLFYL